MPAPRARLAALVTAALLLVLGIAPAAPAATATAPPTTFTWSSSDVLISPQPDAAHDIVSVKDPTVVRHDGKWHVFATTANTDGEWSLTYTSFRNWAEADTAPQYHLDQTAIGEGYRAAPQVFYFAPEKTWYLIYQTGLPSYSTTTDISDPTSWSAPRNFQEEMPPIVEENIGNGYWLDYWVICDDTMCHLFSSDDNGQLYRAETSVEEFPHGFDNTVIAMEDTKENLFEAANVYRLGDADRYLLLVEAIGAEGRRYFRSWTSDSIAEGWTPLAATESDPFAGAANVTFPRGSWTEDISHGEMLRSGTDQTMEIHPCRFQYLYQGMDPSAGGDYSQLPWRLGLLTQRHARC
ncbi:non-reducing end alpha-L-arabinofuranosidase family hydrolase [Streptomyces litchfieldiae]|uniref:non-reducing end alpha-L-arabinofuranosidase n=1 Tax=Streptomyces litchfieldiae TaxID=3075543 RepID=A0ABU2MZ10_9ACTN|nr:non-reducing end alpha-L-arabinofuranosidase family hydrolase [Streptomyces sp. DSM 44938]MDT0345744.1 non-reducing end alpha-L-arabinofuranosidase family hydrolase [Streptomyces sp. DSM 44938]